MKINKWEIIYLGDLLPPESIAQLNEIQDKNIKQARIQAFEEILSWAEKQVGKKCAKTDFIYMQIQKLIQKEKEKDE